MNHPKQDTDNILFCQALERLLHFVARGNATKRTTQIYNPQNYADIYYLIDEEGIIRHMDGVPSATVDKIIGFAQK